MVFTETFRQHEQYLIPLAWELLNQIFHFEWFNKFKDISLISEKSAYVGEEFTFKVEFTPEEIEENQKNGQGELSKIRQNKLDHRSNLGLSRFEEIMLINHMIISDVIRVI